MICQNPEELLAFVNAVFQKNEKAADFRCNSGGDAAYKVSDKAVEQIRSECPSLPWKDILAAADNLIGSDLAIELGTSCQSYVFAVTKNMVSTSIVASQAECVGAIDLQSCLRETLCIKVGSNSSICR